MGQGQKDNDLLTEGQGFMFRLFQQLPYMPASVDGLAAGLVQSRAKTGKGFQFLELRIGKAQGTGDLAIGW